MLLLENISHDDLKKYLKEFYNFAIESLKIDRAPKVFLKRDAVNSEDMFGKTGYYDPDAEEIVLYITKRHPKDVLRSFAHELIHHNQKCVGKNKEVNLSKTSDPAYALHDDGLMKMELEAFTDGNRLFRTWCDLKKQEREKNMSEGKIIEELIKRVANRLIKESKSEKKERGTTLQRKNPDYKKTGLAKLNAAARKAREEKSKEDEIDKEASDLNNDDKLSDYEKTRGKAIARSIAKQKLEKVKGKAKKDAKETLKHQLGKDSKKEKIEEDNTFDDAEYNQKLEESLTHPHPKLTEKKERLFNERFNEYEKWKFEELKKKFIK